MSRLIDLTGQKFGRLIVIRRMDNDNKGNSCWLCQCNCIDKKEIVVRGWCLKNGNTKSCGCLAKNNALKHGHDRKGQITSTYRSWYHIIQRCTNHNNKYYKDYGGRGITVCDEWLKFENFLEDMGEAPVGYQIDRINNNLGYYKENCHWTTSKINNRNRRDNCLIAYNGRIQCLAVWAEELKINRSTLWMRIYRYGWSTERTLTTPVKNKKIINIICGTNILF